MIKHSIRKIFQNVGITWPGWYTIFIWIAGVIILFAFTIKDFLPLFNEYTNNNVATQIKVAGHNRTIKPPAVVLCFPRQDITLEKIIENISRAANENLSCLDCEKMANRSWDVWTGLDFQNVTSIDDYRLALSAALIKNLLSTNKNNFDVLNITNFDWNQPIIEAVWNLFSCLRTVDQLGYGFQDENQKWCFQDEIGNILFSNKEKLEKLFERMTDILSQHVSHKYGTSYKMMRISNAFAPENRIRLIFLLYGLVYSVPIPIDKMVRVVINASSPYGIWESLNISNNYVLVLESLAVISWPLSFFTESDVIYQTFELAGGVEMAYELTLKVTEGRDGTYCHEEESTYACRGNCMIKKITDLCQCIPFTFRDLASASSDLPYCKLSDYDKCPINKSDEYEKCGDKCSNPCTYTMHQWHFNRRPLADEKHFVFSLLIRPVISPFIEFTVTKKNTWEQFISQVGGVVNLYLGFSGVSIIAMTIYCLNLSKRWYYTKKANAIKIIDTILCTRPSDSINTISNSNFPDCVENANIPEMATKDSELDIMKQKLQDFKKEMKADNEEIKDLLRSLEKKIKQ